MLKTIVIRTTYAFILILCIIATAGVSVLLESKQFVFEKIVKKTESYIETSPFPVSVNPKTQTIETADLLGNHESETLAMRSGGKSENWQSKIVAFFAQKNWYQNLASPTGRIVVIWPGQRKEELTEDIGDILRWNTSQRNEFMELISSSEPALTEGKFYPGEYIVHRGTTPQEIATLVEEKFNEDILTRYTDEVSAKVPLEDALVIASLLEREASDFENMREVSGVIWNRLFINMPLQLDATLQYVRGGKSNEKNWWPIPKPADKFLKSPYNTYANKGLPPSAIGNPSAAAVLAALNPIATNCLYYFHDDDGGYHCSETYEGHVAKLKAKYGRGS